MGLNVNKASIILTNYFNIIPRYSALIVNIIHIIFISSIIYYLYNLEKCYCYEDINNKNYSNISYLICIEGIILIFSILTALFALLVIIDMNKIKQKGGNINNKLDIIYLLVILFITIYFVYNVYKLFENIDRKSETQTQNDSYCKCNKSWLRYLLYIQSIIMTIGIISNLLLLLSIFN